MNTILRGLAAAALLLPGLAAADSFPRLIGSGEGLSIEYGPGPHGNVVGGGAVSVIAAQGERFEVAHHDDSLVQRRADGRLPLLAGSGEGLTIVWIEAMPQTLMAGLAR